MRFTVFILLLCAASLLRADDWPMEGKTPSHAAVTTDTPTPPFTLAWTFTAEGPITAAPVVKDGLLVVGAYDGVCYALDALTGAEVWRFHATRDLFFWAPAALGKGVAVIGDGGGVIQGRDAKTGESLWKVGTGGVISGGATLNGDTAYVGSMDGVLYALSIKTGRVRWRAGARWSLLAAPAVDADRGVCYAGAKDGRLYALYTIDGTSLWTAKLSEEAGPVGAPVVAGDRVLVSAHPGVLCCVKATTGAPLWSIATGAEEAGCAVADTAVLAGTRDGLSAFALDTGALRWAFHDAAPAARGVPVVSGKYVFFAARNGAVYALESATGKLAWKTTTGGPIDAGPVIANGRLYVTSTDGKVYCYHAPEKPPFRQE